MNYNYHTYEDFIEKFRILVKKYKLKNSSQREYIIKVLFESKGHLSAEQILFAVKDMYNINISIATIYRVLSFLEEIKVISYLLLENTDTKIFELNIKSHNDHLICEKCKRVIEFYNSKLEQIQEDIANSHSFKLLSHNMILYGLCENYHKQ